MWFTYFKIKRLPRRGISGTFYLGPKNGHKGLRRSGIRYQPIHRPPAILKK